MKNKQVMIESVKAFFEKYPECMSKGRITTQEEIDSIPGKIRKRIPAWYFEILMQFPLAELEIWLPSDHGQDALIGKPYSELPTMSMTFLSTQEISMNSQELFPTFKLIKKNYFCIGEDMRNTGEGIYLHSKQYNPEVLMVFHDFGPKSKDLIKNAERLFQSFTDMFNNALPENREVDW